MAEGSGGVRGSSSKPPSSLLATRSTIMYIFGMNPPNRPCERKYGYRTQA
jgi:hypothetical protein